MKALNVLLISMSFLPAAVQAHSNNYPNAESLKPLNNPIYSVNNYKQPNLAAAALRWENKDEVWVKKMTFSDTKLANYKTHLSTTKPVGSVTLPYTPHNNLSNWNYKIPHLNELKSTGSESDLHVKKHHKNNHITVGR
ncbi:hypothetical protein [Spirosoma flavum]|uniref:Uncharacterized protein n=1 Tax=Spirosoma flavum TaxID=2048557 RepID=A0ABW6AG03_9BACT